MTLVNQMCKHDNIIKKYNSFESIPVPRLSMARGQLHFLSSSEIQLIHDTSLRILDEVGILVRSSSVTKMLIEAGARRSKEDARLLISNDMVRAALLSAPKSILLASRNGKNDMRIPTDSSLFIANGGEGVYVKDMLTGAMRPSTLADVRDFAFLVDSLPQIDFSWNMVGALDQPAEKKGIAELIAGLENTNKHIQGGATTASEAETTVRILEAISGDLESFAKKPFFSSVQCPISPLSFEAGLAEAQVVLSKANVPIVAMVASVTGLTSPVTISGSLAQINAENLASLVISQTAQKGAPWIYSSDSAPGNLRTGSIDYGSIEGPLLRTGAGQMGRHYGLPVMCGGMSLENTAPLLAQASEGIPYFAIMALIPTDLSSGFGGVDSAAGASFEMLLADAWVWDLAMEFIREFEVDEDSISFETIREAALDKDFLGKRHTLSRFKEESAATRKPDAYFSEGPLEGKRKDLLRLAKKEVTKMLAMPRPSLLSRDEGSELERLAKAH